MWWVGVLPEWAARTGTSLAQAGSHLPSHGAGCVSEDTPSALQNQKEKAEFVPAGYRFGVGFFPLPRNKSCPKVVRFCICWAKITL